jgi:hypothetical protein
MEQQQNFPAQIKLCSGSKKLKDDISRKPEI